jgi:hypothetical protein
VLEITVHHHYPVPNRVSESGDDRAREPTGAFGWLAVEQPDVDPRFGCESKNCRWRVVRAVVDEQDFNLSSRHCGSNPVHERSNIA